jgi:putative FmdB family regulatory protein
MPLYEYGCTDCNQKFNLRHPYKEQITICKLCGSEGCVKKILSSSLIVSEKDKDPNKKLKTGTVTNQAIEDARTDLVKQKKELKKKNK